MQVGLISGRTLDGDLVNIVVNKDMVHLNSDKLASIKEMVELLMNSGDILVRQFEIRKTKESRDRFYMRFYRVYRRLNRTEAKLPIILS